MGTQAWASTLMWNQTTEVTVLGTDVTTTAIARNTTDLLVFKPIDWSSWSIVMRAVLGIIGMIGNFLVILIYKIKIRNNTSMNTLITGLAVADCLTSANLIPLPTLETVPDNLIGHILCRVLFPLNILFVCIVASVFTLTMMSIEQCLAVLFPIKNRLMFSKSRSKIILIFVWIASFLINAFTYVVTYRNPETGKCDYHFGAPWVQSLNGIFVFVLEYFIPMVIMVATHAATVHCLRAQERSILLQNQRTASYDVRRECVMIRARQKVLKMLFVVVMTFIICWTPDQIGFLLYNTGLVEPTFLFGQMWSVFLTLAFVNSCANPFIYTASNPQFRLALKALWERKTSERRHKAQGVEAKHSDPTVSTAMDLLDVHTNL